MKPEELEGRLAALEYVATIALQRWGLQRYASGYPTRFPYVRDQIISQIDDGTIKAPESPKARETMKESLVAMFDAPPLPAPETLDPAESAHDAHYFPPQGT